MSGFGFDNIFVIKYLEISECTGDFLKVFSEKELDFAESSMDIQYIFLKFLLQPDTNIVISKDKIFSILEFLINYYLPKKLNIFNKLEDLTVISIFI